MRGKKERVGASGLPPQQLGSVRPCRRAALAPRFLRWAFGKPRTSSTDDSSASLPFPASARSVGSGGAPCAGSSSGAPAAPSTSCGGRAGVERTGGGGGVTPSSHDAHRSPICARTFAPWPWMPAPPPDRGRPGRPCRRRAPDAVHRGLARARGAGRVWASRFRARPRSRRPKRAQNGSGYDFNRAGNVRAARSMDMSASASGPRDMNMAHPATRLCRAPARPGAPGWRRGRARAPRSFPSPPPGGASARRVVCVPPEHNGARGGDRGELYRRVYRLSTRSIA